jgi:TRAP-type mannitol/chloroaromatic compound transport system permease small subunit
MIQMIIRPLKGDTLIVSLLRGIDRLSENSGKITSYLLYPGIFVLTWEVTARYIFDAPTIWAHGVSERLFAIYYIISGAYLLRYKVHINMDLFYSRQTPRTRAILDLFGDMLLFVICAVLLWQGALFAWESLRQLEPDATIFRAPVYPVKIMMPLAGLLLFIQGISITGKEIGEDVDIRMKSEGR